MTLFGYLENHWSILVVLIGMALVLNTDVHLEKRMIFRIALTDTILFIYTVTCYIESCLGNLETFTILRSILCATNYALISFILVNIIMIVYPKQTYYLYFPAILNTVLSFVSIPTKIVFYFTSDNHFQRGPLGYLAYFVSALYLIYLFINLFFNNKFHKSEIFLPIFMSITAIVCLITPAFIYETSQHWFNITIAIDILLYYIFLLQQFTKRDPLTNLLNRQSYYSDAERLSKDITAVITMDMDGLKELNDSKGHVAGDTALKALADCFWKSSKRNHRVYRIGGDEYTILCLGGDEKEVQELIKRIRGQVAKTPYTCSIGYAMKTDNTSIDKLYQLADSQLYVEKKQYYERSGKLRRKR